MAAFPTRSTARAYAGTANRYTTITSQAWEEAGWRTRTSILISSILTSTPNSYMFEVRDIVFWFFFSGGRGRDEGGDDWWVLFTLVEICDELYVLFASAIFTGEINFSQRLSLYWINLHVSFAIVLLVDSFVSTILFGLDYWMNPHWLTGWISIDSGIAKYMFLMT